MFNVETTMEEAKKSVIALVEKAKVLEEETGAKALYNYCITIDEGVCIEDKEFREHKGETLDMSIFLKYMDYFPDFTHVLITHLYFTLIYE